MNEALESVQLPQKLADWERGAEGDDWVLRQLQQGGSCAGIAGAAPLQCFFEPSEASPSAQATYWNGVLGDCSVVAYNFFGSAALDEVSDVHSLTFPRRQEAERCSDVAAAPDCTSQQDHDGGDLFGALHSQLLSAGAAAYRQLDLPLSLPHLPYGEAFGPDIVERATKRPALGSFQHQTGGEWPTHDEHCHGSSSAARICSAASLLPPEVAHAAAALAGPDVGAVGVPLLPLGWERAAYRERGASAGAAGAAALRAFPRLSQEGRAALTCAQGDRAAAAAAGGDAELIRHAVAALVGIPGAHFPISGSGSNSGSAAVVARRNALLGEFLTAGERYRALEAAARRCCCCDTLYGGGWGSTAGRVRCGFGGALLRQLTRVQAEALNVDALRPRTLVALLIRSRRLRARLAALAKAARGARGEHDPAAEEADAMIRRLLAHACAVGAAGAAGGSGGSAATSHDVAVSLLCAAARPLLAALRDCLWSGDGAATDDLFAAALEHASAGSQTRGDGTGVRGGASAAAAGILTPETAQRAAAAAVHMRVLRAAATAAPQYFKAVSMPPLPRLELALRRLRDYLAALQRHLLQRSAAVEALEEELNERASAAEAAERAARLLRLRQLKRARAAARAAAAVAADAAQEGRRAWAQVLIEDAATRKGEAAAAQERDAAADAAIATAAAAAASARDAELLTTAAAIEDHYAVLSAAADRRAAAARWRAARRDRVAAAPQQLRALHAGDAAAFAHPGGASEGGSGGSAGGVAGPLLPQPQQQQQQRQEDGGGGDVEQEQMPAQLAGVSASAPGMLAAEMLLLPPTPDAQEGAVCAAGTESGARASGSEHDASGSKHVPLAARMLPMVATTTVVSGAAGAVRDAVAQPEVERPAAGLMTASAGGRGSDQSAASPAKAQQAAALDTDSALTDICFHTAPSLVQNIARARDAADPLAHAISAADSDSSDDSDDESPAAGTGAAAGAAADTAAERQLPLSELVRRCVEAPVIAQCSAIERVACLYFTRECDLLGHARALRRFLLCHGSAFLADFTERLHAGLVSGGGAGRCDWRRAHNLRDAFHASASAARLDEAPHFNNFSYVVDTAALAAAGGGGRALLHPHAPATLSFVAPRYALPPPLRAVLTDADVAPYVAVHAALFRNHHTALRLRTLCLTLREADAASHSGGGGDVRLRLRALHAFRHELQHASDCLRAHAAAQVERGWDALEARLRARGGGTSAAALGRAHGAYIHGVHVRCFLGSGAVSLAVRNAIDEFHAVVCAVGRVLASHASRAQLAAAEAAAAAGGDVGAAVLTASGSSWPVSDACFASVLAERKRFECVMRQLCDTLVEGALSSAADGDHAQSLLVMLGRESSDALQACR